jgi:hypothetical protein
MSKEQRIYKIDQEIEALKKVIEEKSKRGEACNSESQAMAGLSFQRRTLYYNSSNQIFKKEPVTLSNNINY